MNLNTLKTFGELSYTEKQLVKENVKTYCKVENNDSSNASNVDVLNSLCLWEPVPAWTQYLNITKIYRIHSPRKHFRLS